MPTDIEQYTRVAEDFQSELSRLRKKRFSNLIDDAGNQYVDLVMEGGGVLGLALVGFTYGLEQAGLRFRSTAGTSAGAIGALFIQAVAEPHEARSASLVPLIAEMPMDKFQDGGSDGRNFVDSWVNSTRARYYTWVRIIDDIFRLGLNPGNEFHKWAKQALRASNITTLDDLLKHMQTKPQGLRIVDSALPQNSTDNAAWTPQFAVVTAELATTSKIVFPKHAELFYKDPMRASPADFVRASMSVPGFFEPFRKTALPPATATKPLWERLQHNGRPPSEAVFVDGGMISNFPINLFHVPGVPNVPTFGIKLGVDKDKPRVIDSVKNYAFAMLDCMRHDADNQFIYNNPDYKHIVTSIETGEHHWLNFDMRETAKIDLFRRGFTHAMAFLNGFNWDAYRARRQQLASIDNSDTLKSTDKPKSTDASPPKAKSASKPKGKAAKDKKAKKPKK